MASDPSDDNLDLILERVADLAQSMPARTFLDLLNEVAGDMAAEGVPVEELASICDRICAQLQIEVGVRLH